MKKNISLTLGLLSLLVTSGLGGSATWALNAGTSGGDASNWVPNTVPDGPDDVATFDLSNSTIVTVNSKEVNSVAFNAGASAYTINSTGIGALSITGTGVINNSGTTQNFVATATSAFIGVDNSASAGGNDVVFTAMGSSTTDNGRVDFHDVANGGNATLIAQGSDTAVTFAGELTFWNNSSAGNATVIAEAGVGAGGAGGQVSFKQ
jgi:hypothetical protein